MAAVESFVEHRSYGRRLAAAARTEFEVALSVGVVETERSLNGEWHRAGCRYCSLGVAQSHLSSLVLQVCQHEDGRNETCQS